MIEINQYIDKDHLPPGPQLPEVYPELNLEPKKGTQYYYDKLMQAAQNPGTCPNLDKVLEACNGEGEGEGQIKVQVSINGKGEVEVEVPGHGTWE